MQNNQKTIIEHLFYFVNRTKIRKVLKKYFFLDTERFILQADKKKNDCAKALHIEQGYLKVISFIVLIGMAEPVASLLIR